MLELSVTTVILGIIAVVAFSIVYNQTAIFNKLFSHTIAMGDGRKAVRVMRFDFRNLAHGGIQKMTEDAFKFNDADNKSVDYKFDKNQIERNGSVILSGIKNAPFAYLNAQKKVTSNKDSVKFIRVIFDIAANNETYVLKETIYARN